MKMLELVDNNVGNVKDVTANNDVETKPHSFYIVEHTVYIRVVLDI